LLLVLDSNEYIFAFGIFKKPTCEILLDTILDTFPAHSIRIPRLIIEEVSRHLTPEEIKEFIEFVINLTTIDEDFVVPFELGVRYELKGLKPSDALIAAYVEWTGAEVLVTENRHFLGLHSNLPFKVLNAEDWLNLIKSTLR
jgi:predicted nucleic acid-binding protein